MEGGREGGGEETDQFSPVYISYFCYHCTVIELD